MNPNDATNAVISTGRSRVRAPSSTARRNGRPSSRRLRIKAIITNPLSTATPDKAIKPTPADIDRGMSRNHKATTPPVKAKGMPVNTSMPSLRLLNIMNSRANTSSKATGTTICKRFAADCSCSNCPPQVVQYPAGTCTCWSICVSASCTNEPISRPRTLALTTTSRLPFSRLTWLGPSTRSRLATSASVIKPIPALLPALAGTGISRRASPWTSARKSSGRRTTMSKRRSPSYNVPAWRPPSATAMVSCTSPILRPKRAALSRSILMVNTGRPDVCSTLTSEAPATRCNVWAICPAVLLSRSMSSPKTLTATSLRTPEINSLKRNWIGWDNS
ncbi:hypothetical protein D9M71_220650 [compost metagenome]